MKSRTSIRILTLVLIAFCCFVIIETVQNNSADAAPTGKRWAMILGLNDYMKGVKPLHCAVNDARQVENTLVNFAGFKKENVFLLTTDQRGKNVPTRANIIHWLRKIRKSAGPNDTVVFFFSGHGIQMDEEGYLLTFEADPADDMTLECSTLPVSMLGKWLKRLKVAKKVLFIDACRDDPRTGYMPNGVIASNIHADFPVPGKGLLLAGGDNVMKEDFSKNLVITAPTGGDGQGGRFSATFFSCEVGQRSYEWREKNIGFFTYYLIKGIQGHAKTKEGSITIRSMREYVRPQVSQAVQKIRKKRQEPRVVVKPRTGSKWALSTPKHREGAVIPKETASRNEPVLVAMDTSKALQNVARRKCGSKILCTVEVVTNVVESRSYNRMTKEIQQNRYELDKKKLHDGVAKIINDTGKMQVTENPDEADVWVFFNVLPTKNMTVDVMVRDARLGKFIYKANDSFYRPYPGDENQLVKRSVKVFGDKYVKPMETAVTKAQKEVLRKINKDAGDTGEPQKGRE